MRIDHVIFDYWEAIFFDGTLIFVVEQASFTSVMPFVVSTKTVVESYQVHVIEQVDDHDFMAGVPSGKDNMTALEHAEHLARKYAPTVQAGSLDGLWYAVSLHGIKMTQKRREQIESQLHEKQQKTLRCILDEAIKKARL